jgi:hypothetical protein
VQRVTEETLAAVMGNLIGRQQMVLDAQGPHIECVFS